jgi:hypothetical protein
MGAAEDDPRSQNFEDGAAAGAGYSTHDETAEEGLLDDGGGHRHDDGDQLERVDPPPVAGRGGPKRTKKPA